MERYRLSAGRNESWDHPAPGVRTLRREIDGLHLRMVEISSDADHPHWCTTGHAGSVVSGVLEIEFADGAVRYEAGDGLLIPAGFEHRHRPRARSSSVRLALVDYPDPAEEPSIPASQTGLPLTVRAAVEADAPEIAAILNTIIEDGRWTVLDAPLSVTQERAFIRNFPPQGVFQVALDRASGAVAGFQTVEPYDAPYTNAFDHVGVIGTYVAANRRRQGVARRLFEATAGLAFERGFRKLFTFVRADNAAALAAYRRAHFRVIGTARRHARLGERWIDEVLIERLLDPNPSGDPRQP